MTKFGCTRSQERRANLRLLARARRALGLRGGKKGVVFAAAAERLGRPKPLGKPSGYALLKELCTTLPVPAKTARTPFVKPHSLADNAELFVTTDAFLAGYEWRRLRMTVIKERGRRCECCGAIPGPLNDVVINVDHIKPRRLFPELALTKANLQILCHECNHGKGNWDQTDWRANDPPAVDFRPVYTVAKG